MPLFSLILAVGMYFGLDRYESATCSINIFLVQGAPLFCCTLSNGQRCCAQGLDSNGKVLGCGC
jgi:hypothetical protein